MTMRVFGSARRYVEKIRRQSTRVPAVSVERPVEPHLIQQVLSLFDVGIAFYVSPNFNIQAAMPNKFFEYVLAGIPPIVAPGTSMAAFCEEHRVGFVAGEATYSGLRETLVRITPEMLAEQQVRLAEVRGIVQKHSTSEHFAATIGLV